MFHLTNDYRKLLRRNGPKAALSLCVALALSGGLVSAEGKTYDYVNPWGSREALEGDPIEVEWMRGGEGTLQAGTDETGNVRIHHLKTWGNPDTYAYVKGKKITIEDRDPSDPTANWGGKMYIGGDTTESVTMKGLHAGNQSETTIYGRTISMGTLGTGDGQFTIGNKNTELVTINDFEAAKGSSTSINGHSVSMGSLNNWGGTVTVKTDGDFKAVKDNNLQDVGVTGGGRLTVYSDSFSANKLTIANKDSSVSINGENSIDLGHGLSSAEQSKVELDSSLITVKGKEGFGLITVANGSSAQFRGKDLYVEGGLNIANSTFTADETGTLQIGQEDTYTSFTFTGSRVSLGTKDSETKLYGHILSTESSEVDIHGRDILIDGVYIDPKPYFPCSIDSILTNAAVIRVGDNDSNLWLKGRLFNTASDVTVNGRKIRITAAEAVNGDASKMVDSGYAIRTTGDNNTAIGSENTDNIVVDGTIWGDYGSLSIHGRNIQLSYAQGIALSGGAGAHIFAGGNETENLVIQGQAANLSADKIQLSGEHIIIDSTGYGGPKNGVQFPESLLAYHNDIDAGTEHTKAIYISGGLRALYGDIHVLGQDITVGTSDYFTHGAESKSGPSQTGYIALAEEKDINIGDKNSDMVQLYGGQILARGGNINVQGKNIVAKASDAYISPVHVKVVSGDTFLEDYQRVSMIGALGANVDIGSDDSESIALQGGTLLADGAYYDNNYHQIPSYINVLGKNISIDGKKQWAGETNAGRLKFGSESSDQVSIQGKGGIHARGGRADILGKWISIQSDTENALENNGAPIVVGSPNTQSIHVSGGIVSHGSQISLQGRDVSISKGKQENAIHTDGGTVSITATGGEDAHISGPVRNDKGTVEISLSGKTSHLDSQVTTDITYRGTTDISLFDKASWNPAGDTSNFTTYTGNDGIIHLDNNTHQTVTVSAFKDADTRIHEDIYGSKNTGNDTIHIDNTYTGHTHFWLVNREGTDKGVVGTILASAGTKESPKAGTNSVMVMAALNSAENNDSSDISQFTSDHFAAYGMNSLFFKTYNLGIQDSNVEKNNKISDTTKGNLYDKDLYITGVTNHTTNEHGQYTPTVSTALSGSSLMYYTWRTENDKMLQRVGDLRENEGEETGLWARIRGSRIGKSHSDRGFKNQYKVYEIGYDAKTEDNDRMKSFTGIAFSYLDGKGYYTDGRGTNQAASAAIYHTDIHKTGHYLDLVFRIRHMNERLHTHTTVDTDIGPITEDHSSSMDTTGLSFSAEYGRKKFVGNGWYVEPQTQWTLGYLGPNQYEMDNGTRVEQPGITSFVGRVGFNLGRQVNPNSIVYLKANVYHEFGGHSPIHLYAGDESLSFTDTFDDTWFEYGVGFAMKLGSRLSLYGDFEKNAGSHFYKDWQWNAGIRYSF